ncbi:right-handed parallel beta-helix repeat-containing protein [Flavobacterium fluviatile]|uniref:right-handed parallel beta-helix repeat-containing protein n=1 Tax=Flavobacterium fluviatile TaxID=1862387 RepID=UPI0013D3AE84|nr:Ig-like domain-containing protein [Flavobacterium fluviatile]
MRIKMMLRLIVFFALLSCQKDDDAPNEVSPVLIQKIEIQGTDITSGVTGQMTAKVTPDNATDKSVIWKVSDATIADISATGLITAKKNGTITVTATANDKSAVVVTKVINVKSFSTTPIADYEVSTVAELNTALGKVKAGETIVLNGGTYAMTSKITITTSGTSDKMITLKAKDGAARPKLDFSAMSEGSANQGIVLTASYWHIKGIDIYKAGDNGMQVKGSNNVIEFMTFSECSDSGLQLDNGAANNTILNCDSYFNADSSLENADGFACKLNAGTGNKFIGCRAWQNLDDGWDGYLRGTDNISTTYQNCWAVKNGYLKDGSKGAGDGNGFKTGGSDDKLLKHNAKYTNCIAAGNVADGFDHNSNRGEVTIYNCSAYDNGRSYSFSSSNPLAKLIIKNSNVLGAYGTTLADVVDSSNNSWQNGITVTADDFTSIDYTQLLGARKADGSLPDVTFFHLKSDSDMINKGVDVGLPFNGTLPDLGAFEF